MSSHTVREGQYRPDDRIIQAARRLLSSSKSSDFTMDLLAKESGVSRATLYRQVGSREKLLKHLVKKEGLPLDNHLLKDNRTRILEAARATISATGSLNVTVEQVANEAGVGVATVYRHFDDKAGMLKAFSEEFTPRQYVRDLILRSGANVEEDLIRFAQEALQFIVEHRDLARLLFSADDKTAQAMAALRASQERTLDLLTRYLEKLIQAGKIVDQPPFDLANAFMGMILGFVFVKPTYPNFQRHESELVARFIVRLFLNGVRRPSDDPEREAGAPAKRDSKGTRL